MTAAQLAPNPEQLAALYVDLRRVTLDSWLKAEPDEITKRIAAAGEAGAEFAAGKDPHRFGTSIRLMGRLAHEADEETFIDALTSGQFPPMKLSAEEMEAVRGGAALTISLGACIAWTAGVAIGGTLLGIGIAWAAS